MSSPSSRSSSGSSAIPNRARKTPPPPPPSAPYFGKVVVQTRSPLISTLSRFSSSSSSPSALLLLLFLLSVPCDDWSFSRPRASFASATETDEWSLNCDEDLYYGALNRSATLACRIGGVDLYDPRTFSTVKWIKWPEEYTALEVLRPNSRPPEITSYDTYADRVSMPPAPSSSATPPSSLSSTSSSALITDPATDVSLTIDNLIPSDFGSYKIEVYYARDFTFRDPKRVFPVILEEAHGPASISIVGNRPIRADSLLILKCRAESVNPAPVISWFRRGVVVNNGSSSSTVEESSLNGRRNNVTDGFGGGGASISSFDAASAAGDRKSLDVVAEYNLVPSASQNGDVIECRVSNPIDPEKERTSSVVLNVTFPPTIPRITLTHENADWIVANRDQLEVECDLRDGAIGNPQAEVALYRDGVKLTPSFDEKSRIGFRTQVARDDDSATFKCVAKNSIGETESETRRIRVAYGPTSVRVNASDTRVKAGETVTLRCSVEGTSPPPIIQWLRGGEIFQTGAASNAIPEDESNETVYHEMLLTLTAEDNGASYDCLAINEESGYLARSNASVAFTVHFPCGHPEISMNPYRPWFVEGEKIEAEVVCRLNDVGNPPATLTLKKGEETLKTAVADRLLYEIDSFQPSDDGVVFRCEAWNDIETSFDKENNAMSSAAAGVVIPRVKVDPLEPISVAYGPPHVRISHASAPNESVVVRAGKVLLLNCTAPSSNPPADVWWIEKLTRNGSIFSEPLSHPAGVTSVSLDYKVTERDNNKSFACRAENKRTKIVRESPVVIKVLYGPQWVEEGRNLYSARIGKRKELKCSVSANPPINAWEWRDATGAEMDIDKYHSAQEQHGKHGVKLDFKQTAHVIEKVAMDDFGNYTCLASNDGGTTWTSFPLSLTPAQPPDVPLNCSETRVNMTDLSVSFVCVAGFDGGAPQKEYKVSIWSADNRNNETWKDKLVRVPRKDDVFSVVLVDADLSQILRRGVEYRVCLHLCNKFGCSVCFDRGLGFTVPTTPPPTMAPTVTTASPYKGTTKGLNSKNGGRSLSPFSYGGVLGLVSLLLLPWTVSS